MGMLWSFTQPQKALSVKMTWDSRAMLHFQPGLCLEPGLFPKMSF